jgi:two-component system, LytTR family, response regulator
MRVLIVDDERPARNRLRRLLEAMDGIEIVGEADTGLAALETIEREKPDLVFLDVQMPAPNGFEVVRELRPPDIPLVIFATSYDQYALQAFEVSAVDYLLKPVEPERLEKAIAKARQLLEARQGARHTMANLERLGAALSQAPRSYLERVVGRRGPRMHVLPLRQVHGFVAEDELVFALIGDGRMLVNYTLRDLEARLDPEKFARVHKQTIVNLASITEIEPLSSGGAMARLQSGASIEISRRYRGVLQEKLGW